MIEHMGNDCPVPGDTLVRLKFENGDAKGLARSILWGDTHRRVTHYEVIEPSAWYTHIYSTICPVDLRVFVKVKIDGKTCIMSPRDVDWTGSNLIEYRVVPTPVVPSSDAPCAPIEWDGDAMLQDGMIVKLGTIAYIGANQVCIKQSDGTLIIKGYGYIEPVATVYERVVDKLFTVSVVRDERVALLAKDLEQLVRDGLITINEAEL